jgi:hypothetical protein
MYACISETGRGFFAEVCGGENRPPTFRDPPPLSLASRSESGKHTLAVPSVRVYAGSWIWSSENTLLLSKSVRRLAHSLMTR